MTLRLASRGSTLALWQARHVQTRLCTARNDLAVHIDVLQTTGDRITDVPLAMIGDRGLFTKEVDDAVLDGRAHAAVHSYKDVPTRLAPGLVVAAVLERGDPRDVFLPAPGGAGSIADLRPGARVGTSSLRRRALLLGERPDIVVEDLRGNLDTRLRRLDEGSYDGIILALAGLRRFGGEQRVVDLLDTPHWLPAAGQGALAVVARADDAETLALLRPLEHAASRAATVAERALLGSLEGGCQIPIGVLGVIDGTRLTLHALVASLDGRTIVRDHLHGDAAEAADIGEALARQLVRAGADEVLRNVRAATAAVPRPAAP